MNQFVCGILRDDAKSPLWNQWNILCMCSKKPCVVRLVPLPGSSNHIWRGVVFPHIESMEVIEFELHHGRMQHLSGCKWEFYKFLKTIGFDVKPWEQSESADEKKHITATDPCMAWVSSPYDDTAWESLNMVWGALQRNCTIDQTAFDILLQSTQLKSRQHSIRWWRARVLLVIYKQTHDLVLAQPQLPQGDLVPVQPQPTSPPQLPERVLGSCSAQPLQPPQPQLPERVLGSCSAQPLQLQLPERVMGSYLTKVPQASNIGISDTMIYIYTSQYVQAMRDLYNNEFALL